MLLDRKYFIIYLNLNAVMKLLAIVESIGLGHAIRTYEALKEFKKNGYTITVIANNSAAAFFRKNGMNTIDIPLSIDLAKKDDGKLDVSRTLLENIKVRNIAAVGKIRNVIKREKPNVILIDASIIGVMASNIAKTGNIAVIFISNDNTYPSGFKNDLRRFEGFDIIDRFVRISVDAYFVPDFPPPYTIADYNIIPKPKMIYVGPLSWAYREKPLKKTKGILLTQGKSSVISERVASLLKDKVKIVDEKNYIAEFLKSEIIVHHGGHTTIMDCILLEKPQIAMPIKTYTERTNNAKKVEELKLGKMLDEEFLDINTFEHAVEEVRDYKKYIRSFSKYARSYNAPKKIFDITESLLKR